MMNFKLQSVLPVLIVVLFAACGNPPLIVPERTESIAQSEQVVQAEPTATLAIVGGSADSPLASPTASVEPTDVIESPTPNPSPTATSPGGRPSETPRPTRTPGPPTQTPRATRTPPPLATITPEATPDIEATETPLAPGIGVEITEIIPLTFDDTTPTGQELRALLNTQPDWSYADYGGDGPFELLGWTPNNEVVVQPIIPNTQQAERPVWAIDPTNGQARPVPNWNLEPVLTQVQQRIVDNFIRQRQPPPKIVRSYPSPGNEHLALQTIQEDTAQNRLHIYRVGTEKEIVVLPQGVADKQTAVTNLAPIWSPDGRKLAYGVAIYQTDEFPTESYELHIIEPGTGHLTKIEPVYYKGYPNSITWSPEGQYVTFSAQRSDNGPLSLFVVKSDGAGLTDLTPDAEYWVLDSVFWSPSSNYLAYGASGRIIWLAKLNIE